jgi:ribosomal-protein-alanine N-acetyltransferase
MVKPSLRPMTVEDIDAVISLERRAMEVGWQPGAYRNEITQNGAARYFVCLDEEAGGQLAGFGGLWLQFDQAHITTVAVDPHYQRRGIGRLLVAVLIRLAREGGMQDATLEVRESNNAARRLYRGFGFFEVGRRVRYYRDNGEDAVIMTTEPLDSPGFSAKFTAAQALVEDAYPDVLASIAM